MKLFPRVAIILALSAAPAVAQVQPLPSTSYTRDLLRSSDAATARLKLGVAAGGTNVGIATLNGRGTNLFVFNFLYGTNYTYPGYLLWDGLSFQQINPDGRVSLVDGSVIATSYIDAALGFNGNGSGISNAVDIIPGTGVTVTTNANNRSFTLSASANAVTAAGASTAQTNGSLVTVTTTNVQPQHLNSTNAAAVGKVYTAISSTSGYWSTPGSILFPLTQDTVLGTNFTGSVERSLIFYTNWNTTDWLGLGFKTAATRNDFFMTATNTHFNTFGGADFQFDQGLGVAENLILGGGATVHTLPNSTTFSGNGTFLFWDPVSHQIGVLGGSGGAQTRNTDSDAETLAWSAGALTVGWPTRYSTHSITSNSWITGFSGVSAGKTLTAFLTITNATASDFTLSVSNSVTSVDGLRSWVCTNKQSRGFSFKVGAQTNSATGGFF